MNARITITDERRAANRAKAIATIAKMPPAERKAALKRAEQLRRHIAQLPTNH